MEAVRTQPHKTKSRFLFSTSTFQTLVWGLVLLAAFVISPWIQQGINPYWFTIIIYCGINIILAVSLNLVNGFTGQFSIGHAGFMAVGAYVAAVVTMALGANPAWNEFVASSGIPANAVLPIGLCLGGVAAAGAGYMVGMPSLRLRGDYLAIVTLGFGEIIRVVMMNTEAVGGASGLNNIPFLSDFGWVYSSVVLTVFCVWRMVHSSHGRTLLAVREDEIAGEAMGVNTTQAKVRAFAMGAFFAGIAGGLYAHQLQILTPQTFDFNRSFEIVIMVVLGGMGSISGSVVAAILLTVLREALRVIQTWYEIDIRMVIYSLVLIILMLTRPNGLFGSREIIDFFPASLRRKLAGRAEARGGVKQ
jgi:branched-chain amino acid transport system permease protein